MSAFDTLPGMGAFIEQFRIQARRQMPRNLVGGHIMRRMGQSLDFRDYARYNRGDDIRHVDWRATMRTHGPDALNASDKWLVRRYMSEEHMKLLISIDPRPTMFYPQADSRTNPPAANISKMQMACWLAQALALIATGNDDRVVLHRLFDKGVQPISNERHILKGLDAASEASADDAPFNDEGLDQFLPPTAIWIIISDLYFDPTRTQRLITRVQSALAGMRWVIFVELDSWPYESARLQRGAWEISGPNSAGKRVNITPQRLDEARRKIDDHRAYILNACRRADFTAWVWPPDLEANTPAAAHYFKRQLMADQTLQRLFMKEEV